MNEVACFAKVSFDEFKKNFTDVDEEQLRTVYDNIKEPARATSGSAGYDFYLPISIELAPGETTIIPTGIRCPMSPSWVLLIFPRSGLGFNYRLQLDNTVGVIDSDDWQSSNEGHIMAKITNDSRDDKMLRLEAGHAFMQGVFVQYGCVVGDDATVQRDGGFGSTDNLLTK